MKPPRIAEWVRSLRLRLVRPLRIRMAGLTRARARGRFVAVTGSSAKSTTTMLIAAILDDEGNVLNQVFENTINPLIRTIRRSRIADFVVVETGVGGKGQMSTMAGLLKPDVSVVTMVGLEHYSAFRSREAIATEKGALVAATAPDGLAVLNAAIAEAERIGQPMCISVVDTGGNLLAFARMDGSKALSVISTKNKATTAALSN